MSGRIFTLTLLFITSTLALAGSSDNPPWELDSNDDGYAIYTRMSPATGYKEVRIETVIDQPMAKLVAINTDAALLPRWMDSFDTVSVVNRNNWHDYVLNITYDFPWPYRDRESTTHSVVTKTADGSVLLDFRSTEDGPRSEDHTHMDLVKGSWQFTAVDEDHTKTVYTCLVSPGGKSPKWVINLFSVDVPLKSVKNLKQFAQSYDKTVDLDDLSKKS